MVEIKTGKYKTKKKYIGFVSAIKGVNVRIISNTAFINGYKLSGMLDNTKFKMIIYDDNTIDLEDISDSKTINNDMLISIIDDIDSLKATGYANKFVVKGLDFILEDGNICYLEVAQETPYERLQRILNSTIIDEQDIETESESIEIYDNNINQEKRTEFFTDIFDKLESDLVKEIKTALDKAKSEYTKIKLDVKTKQTKLYETKKEISKLEKRLSDINTKGKKANGYIFFVSDRNDDDFTELSINDTKIINRIASSLKMNSEILTNLIKGGFYEISIATIDDITNKIVNESIFTTVSNIDIDGDFRILNDKIIYSGELNWHELNNRLLNNGFTQNPQFDILCNSNSYSPETN